MRKNRIILSALTPAFFVTAALAAGAATLPERPEKIEFRPLEFEAPSAKDYRTTLASGVPVYMAPSSEFPLVQITFSFKGGEYLDPADKTGLASMTASMMRRGGTTTMPSDQLDEQLDYLAAVASVGAGATFSTASLNCLSSNIDEAFGLFMDMLKNPGFQEDKTAIYREEAIEQMKQRNDDANPIAGREWQALMYGREHFEARQTTKASLESITSSDMRAFAQKVFQPGNLIIGVTGDFTKDEMIARLDKAMEGWAKGEKMPDPPAPSARITPGVYRVEKDIPQGKVFLGHRGVTRDDPDYFPLLIMNDVLGGGGFTSRLMSRIRSDEGLSYGVRSAWDMPVYYPGVFSVTYASKNPTVALALKICLEEIEKIRSADVPESEIETARASFIETFPRTFESKQAMINVFISDEWTNRSPDYWKNYRENIKKVTAADVKRVAQKHMAPENLAILVVGKWSEIEPGDATPQKPARATMGEFFGGESTALPLRDPLTQEPMAQN
ncbi:MAG: M16 family metallopeptidase [Phycisphaerales bacterium]